MKQLTEMMSKMLEKTGTELGFDPAPQTPEERSQHYREYEQKKADMYNESVGNLNEKDGYDCQVCKNKGFISVVKQNDMFPDIWSETHVPCKCQRARATIRRLERSGLKNIVREYTFSKYEAVEPWQQRIKETAQKFCSDHDGNWFFIGGQSGAGKTHICTAVAVSYIKAGKEVKYMLWRDDITRIKSLVNDSEQYGNMIKELKEAEVLYIDDLFKNGKDELGAVKPPTSADINVAFEIINYRYNNKELVTIISSERTLNELLEIDEAIAGRIAERTKSAGYCLNLKRDQSRNWRMKGLEEI